MKKEDWQGVLFTAFATLLICSIMIIVTLLANWIGI